MSGLINGLHVIVYETFDPMKFLDDIEAYPVRAVFLVPAMIMFILQTPRIEKCDFCQVYGTTETSGFGTILVQTDHANALAGQPGLLRSCGRAAIGASIKLMDSDGKEVAQGDIGEVWLKSDCNMLHYHDLEEATAKSLTDGWVHTGDAGYMDEEGFLYLKDRIKDMVVSGGENIFPKKVENAFGEIAEKRATRSLLGECWSNGRLSRRCQTSR